uniref:DNA-directed RNA polymerase n=1 Tax=Parascaris equorum TaxID=6256 RepID=A0A914RP79_PAREQ
MKLSIIGSNRRACRFIPERSCGDPKSSNVRYLQQKIHFLSPYVIDFSIAVFLRHESIRLLQIRSPARESQFLLGPLSVLVIRAICMREGKGLHDGEVTGYQPDGDDEMLVGRAGFLAAVLNLRCKLFYSSVGSN